MSYEFSQHSVILGDWFLEMELLSFLDLLGLFIELVIAEFS